MDNRVPRFLACVVIFLLLVACGAEASPAESNATVETSFATPLSNQVEVHDENASEEHEQEGEAHAEARHGDEGHDHTHLDPALATAEMGVALVPSELVVGLNRFAVGLFDADGQAVNDA